MKTRHYRVDEIIPLLCQIEGCVDTGESKEIKPWSLLTAMFVVRSLETLKMMQRVLTETFKFTEGCSEDLAINTGDKKRTFPALIELNVLDNSHQSMFTLTSYCDDASKVYASNLLRNHPTEIPLHLFETIDCLRGIDVKVKNYVPVQPHFDLSALVSVYSAKALVSLVIAMQDMHGLTHAPAMKNKYPDVENYPVMMMLTTHKEGDKNHYVLTPLPAVPVK